MSDETSVHINDGVDRTSYYVKMYGRIETRHTRNIIQRGEECNARLKENDEIQRKWSTKDKIQV